VIAPGPANGQQDHDGAEPIIVLRAANNYSGPRFADQQLAEALATMHPVLYVDPASSVVSRRRHPELRDAYAEPKLRPIAPNLTRLSPSALPGMERPGMAAVTSALTARAIRHSARELGARRIALIDTSPLAPVSCWACPSDAWPTASGGCCGGPMWSSRRTRGSQTASARAGARSS
jgi:hypothetical protein